VLSAELNDELGRRVRGEWAAGRVYSGRFGEFFIPDDGSP
jgi:hypothetical protein